MTRTIDIPTDYIRPCVRFELSSQETQMLDNAPINIISGTTDDADTTAFFGGNHEVADDLHNTSKPDAATRTAQLSLLLVLRVMIGIIRWGNPVTYAHLAMDDIMNAGPDKAEERALRWAAPDLSDITGEARETPDIDLSSDVIQVIRRAIATFGHCATVMPSLQVWAQMGIALGIDGNDLDIAMARLMDTGYIFNDLCECSRCTDHESEEA